MSRSSNSLRTSDVITTPIKLKYTSSYDCSTLEQYGITVLSGVNGPVTVTGSIPQDTLNYWSARHLYYSNYLTGSFAVSASSADNFLQSTAASGTFDADVRYFPTESESRIRILSIPRGVFGQRLSRKGFIVSSSAYYLIDDGNGNIIDQAASNIHVGNVIYPQGIIIITNSDYLEVFPYPPTAVNDAGSFLSSDSPKTLNILSNDIAGTGTIITSSVVLSGGDITYFTNNLNGTVTLSATSPGTYTTNYTVKSIVTGGCILTSNLASISINVFPDPTTTTTTTSTTTTTTTAPTTTTSTTTTTTTAPTTTTTTSTTTTTTTEPTTSTTTTTTTEPTTSTTTTTTTEPPTTTTSTTTTTTTEEQVAINLYADQEGVAYNLDFHISTDGGSTWNFTGVSFNNTTCPGSPTLSFNVVKNSSLMVRIGSTTNISTYYRSNRDTVTCPAFDNGTAQCEWSILTNTNRTFYHTTNVEDSSGCPDSTTTTTTSTTTTTTTEPPTTTSTTTTTTTEPPTTTTSTTTTTTTEPPTTTTSTTTTTTTQETVNINLYADQEGIPDTLDFHTSTDGGVTWNFAGVSFSNTTCPGSPTLSFSVVKGSSLMVRMGSTSNINTYYRSNRDTVTCPVFNNGTAQCEWSILTNANRTFYHTTNVQDSSGCPDTTTSTTTETTTEPPQ